MATNQPRLTGDARVAFGVPRALRRFEGILASFGESYLVGSANWPFQAAPADHDYVTSQEPVALAPKLARATGAKYVVLDKERQHVRLILPGTKVVDLAPILCGNIASDLARRDFSINAIAAQLPHRAPVIDPFLGRADLRYGMLRQVSAHALFDDPLRVLRGVRLASTLELVVELATAQSMLSAARQLNEVHPERIRSELLRALSSPHWYRAASMYESLNVWRALPCRPELRPDSALHSLHLRRLRDWSPVVPPTLPADETRETLQLKRGMAVLASVFLSSTFSAFETQAAGQQLRLSRWETEFATDIVSSYERLRSQSALDSTEAYRLLSRYGLAAVLAAVLAGLDTFLASAYSLRRVRPEVIPDGQELCRELGIRPGPKIGFLLEELRQEAALGNISDRTEAFALARTRLAIPSNPGGNGEADDSRGRSCCENQ